MSYTVDPKTMLFTNEMTWPEAKDLHHLVEGIVMNGTHDFRHEAYLAWKEACKLDERQELLMYSIVFPQRALLSLTKLLIPNLPVAQSILTARN
jgi:hypothetical protein